MILNLAAFFYYSRIHPPVYQEFQPVLPELFPSSEICWGESGLLPVGNDDRMVLLLGSVQGICPPKAFQRRPVSGPHGAFFCCFCAVTTPYLPEELPF